jgi:hypothetical protein
MTDTLIRDVSDGAIAAVDGTKARLGVSQLGFLHHPPRMQRLSTR